MISFITWTNNPKEYFAFKKSVEENVYERVEFIAIANTMAKSLSEAYHIGQARAIGDLLVYCHQDIIIRDTRFSRLLHKSCEQPKCGFVGVIGGLHRAVGSWWEQNRNNLRGRVLQSDKTGKRDPVVLDFGKYNGPASQMDGLFLATPRKDWDFYDIKGIHFVDMLMCYQALERGFQNYIADIYLEHTSWGEKESNEYKENFGLYRSHIRGVNRLIPLNGIAK
jgi:hypothetical protein